MGPVFRAILYLGPSSDPLTQINLGQFLVYKVYIQEPITHIAPTTNELFLSQKYVKVFLYTNCIP